ncbi:DUF3618 domain-containing protein [Rhizobium sullae]|uniref:Uncharacterized protein DUF3618 n=1 Tax=Rhizobium sullae TaxID=50338 RepID=A0A4R3PSM8_RHISU|nr:DUF3618 domain-containing protein [Rhizobium sullae]TCU09619.1 uncharacterized protein DUF3618 [Rhizobium sullae]
MTYSSNHHTAAELQREIDTDRQRIEEKLHAIQERMSPGQLIDELIAYTKNSGGAEYVGNLGRTMKTNPVPVALMGVSLAWLMAKTPQTTAPAAEHEETLDDYPLAPVTGTVRRIGPVEESFGERYSHFSDESGKRFRALTDTAGRRAGHFIDESGKTHRGFADAAGRQIDEIFDEAGALFDQASGWAARSWRRLTQSAEKVQATIFDTGGTLHDQGARLNELLERQLRDQPLVSGALAFAVGAAIGAALPHTEQEDEAIGETSDAVRESLSSSADGVMARVVEAGSEIYERTKDVASDVHQAAKDRIKEEARDFQAADNPANSPR